MKENNPTNKYIVVAICGKAGAGKDTVLNSILNRVNNLNSIVSYTTRPPRSNEKDGVDYHFITIEEFEDLVLNNDLIEATRFNNWFYGTGISSLVHDKINIGVFNPEGIEILAEDRRVELYVVLVDAKDKTRIIRQLNREENPDIAEIFRRYQADEEDFKHYIEWNEIVPNLILKNEKRADFNKSLKSLSLFLNNIAVKND